MDHSPPYRDRQIHTHTSMDQWAPRGQGAGPLPPTLTPKGLTPVQGPITKWGPARPGSWVLCSLGNKNEFIQVGWGSLDCSTVFCICCF